MLVPRNQVLKFSHRPRVQNRLGAVDIVARPVRLFTHSRDDTALRADTDEGRRLLTSGKNLAPLSASERRAVSTVRSVFKVLLATAVVSVLIFVLFNMPGSPKRPAAPPFQGPPTNSGYAFSSTMPDGSPVTWRTCDPIEVLVETVGMPPGADEDVDEAVRRIVEASNVNLVYNGTVTGLHREIKDGPTKRQGQILVGWTSSNAEMSGDQTVAFSSATITSWGDEREITGSVITVHTGRLANLRPGFGLGRNQGQIYLHELAHSVGLGHVPDPDQLMHEIVSHFNGNLAEGDIEGLNVLAGNMC